MPDDIHNATAQSATLRDATWSHVSRLGQRVRDSLTRLEVKTQAATAPQPRI